MGDKDILFKLSRELSKDIQDETQAVFILSRIRKYLELKKLQNDYKYLNFYCNWALHPSLDRTEAVSDILKDFVDGTDDLRFLNFDKLYLELKRFNDDNNLPRRIFETENYLRFVNLLVEIYAETPLEFSSGEKRRIVISKPRHRLKDSKFSIGYRIE